MIQRRLAVGVSAVVGIAIVDQVFKNFFIKNPDFVRGFFFGELSLSYNSGVAFGVVLPPFVLVSTIIIALVFLVWSLYGAYRRGRSWTGLAIVAVIAGALSNIIDRVAYGAVVDYLTVVPWYPTFNLADALIVGGIISWLFGERSFARAPRPPR